MQKNNVNPLLKLFTLQTFYLLTLSELLICQQKRTLVALSGSKMESTATVRILM